LLSFQAEVLTGIGTRLFEATGAANQEARLTAQELVTNSLMGHDSHGVIRIPEYLDLVTRGTIVPRGQVSVQHSSATTAVVQCVRTFGPVGAHRAIEVGIEKARQHKVACVITRNCNHVGRVGAYVQVAASQDMIALATCNSPKYGHFVLPWGGLEGRLATNPIAYAVPTQGDPILADISTSVAPEGKIRWHHNQGKLLPEGWIHDAKGNPSKDPAAFYGPPMGGILPLGGSAGHKGFALGLLVEILGSALAGVSTTDPHVVGNGVCFLLIDPSAFCPIARFKELMTGMIAYIKSSPPAPGFTEVLIPGEPEFRTLRQRSVEGVPVDEVTWQAIRAHAGRLQVNLEEVRGS
jgi:uncharacterized oxidoreductase